ncbi:MAG: flagellar biosynthesis anti-sigma factor FlgM [Candidatus Scalinduaceae bacterium]
MSIEKTSGITNNHIDNIIGHKSLKKAENINAELDVSKGKDGLKNVDKVEISSEVKKLLKILSSLKSELKKIPDVREDKVKDAKARIESGYYDKKEIIEKIASSISKLAHFKPSE